MTTNCNLPAAYCEKPRVKGDLCGFLRDQLHADAAAIENGQLRLTAELLADVEGKQHIVELHEPEPLLEDETEPVGDRMCGCCMELYPCRTLQWLGWAYAGRRGYQAAWRP